MYLGSSKDPDEPAHTRSLINASSFLTVLHCIYRSSMGCVLLYLFLFSGLKPN